MSRTLLLALSLIPSLLLATPRCSRGEAIDVTAIKHDGDVDFDSEVLPILRKKCLACHNKTDAESDLVLESPETMLKGGAEGPSIVPGKAAESYLLKLAAHQDEPVMPPEDNDVGASNLTPEELGLLALWINQGAKAGSKKQNKIVWQPLPAGVNPVLAVATSSDGSIVAAGRANQVFVHHVSGIEYGRLTDPVLMKDGIYKQAGVAHLDMVHAIAMSPNNRWLATGGFRTVKIWKRDAALAKEWDGANAKPTTVFSDGTHTFAGYEDGAIHSINAETGESKPIGGLDSAVLGIGRLNETAIFSGATSGKVTVWNADGEKLTESSIKGLAAIVAVGSNRFATTQADAKIHLWAFDPDKNTLAETAALDAHAKSISLLAAAPTGNGIATAANDKITVYDTSSNKQIRQWAHGAKITRLAYSHDATRIATAGENGVIRIWNANDGKQVSELKAAPEVQYTVARARFQLDVANRQVNNSKKDLENAKKRQKQEEDNLKKSQENQKKADEDKKKKDEAAKKAQAEKQQAEKTFQELEARIKAAEKTIADGPTIIAESAKKYEHALTQLAKPQTEFESALADESSAKKARDDAAAKLEGDKENADLKKTLNEAEQQLKDFTSKREAAEKARNTTFKSASDSNLLRQQTEKAIADSKVQLEKDKKDTEPKKKAVADKSKAAEKAVNEQKAAVRTLESAANSIKQATKAIERAKAIVDEKQKSLSHVEGIAKQKDESFKTAEKSRNEFRFAISALRFSPDGKKLASANQEGLICTWSASDGSAIRQFSHDSAPANWRMVFAGNQKLLTIDSAKTRLWNATHSWSLHRTIGSPEGESTLSDRVTALAFSPDSKLLAVGGGQPSRNGELRLYAVDDGSPKNDFPETHSDTVFGIAFSPDGKLIATCAADRFMKITDLASGKVIKTFEGHTHHVLSVSWQADGRVLATAGADKVVKLWNFEEGSQLRTISGFGKEVTSLRHFGPNDSFVAVSGDQSIYNCNSGGQRNGIGKGTDFLYCVSTSQVGNTIVFGGHDSIVRVIDEKGKVLASLEPPK